jgi:hypothetical protein
MKKAMGLLVVLMAICTACAPQVTITEPEDGAIFEEGATIVFKCEATDREDGVLSGESVVWYADSEDTILGTGTEMETEAISRGEHTIIVTATDSDGKVGTDEITITIGQGGSSTTTTSVTAPSTATIGQSGGTVAVGKARLEIPAGALANDTQVSIAEVAGMDRLIGPAYDLQPTGLQFTKPATLIIDYSTQDLPEGSETGDVAIISLNENYEPATDNTAAPLLSSMPFYVETTVDEEDTTASAQLSHFSSYGLTNVCSWTPKSKETAWFVHPTMKLPCDKFDHGETLVLKACLDCLTVTSEGYELEKRGINLNVDASCTVTLCAGSISAQVLIGKIFRVKAGQYTDTVAGAVGCTLVDIGGTETPPTGNCNWGERRVRVMDLGTGETINKQVPLQVATAGDEWIDLPWGTPAPHVQTPASGENYVMPVTFTVGHYYAIVVDLMASSGANYLCGQTIACCDSSQRWTTSEFYVESLLVTGP